MRYFHQSPDYWLDNCTLREWTDIYSRELIETPSADEFAAMYFEYKPPEASGESGQAGEIEEWECPFPDVTD